MMNEVTLLGRAGKQGKKIGNSDNSMSVFSLATSKKWKGNDGQWNEKTEWHSVVGYGYVGDSIATIDKGDLVLVRGEITYTEKDGVNYTNIKAAMVKKIVNRSGDDSGLKRGGSGFEAKKQIVDGMTDDDLPF